MHHKDGHRVPVLVTVNPLLDIHGNIIGAAEVFSDISSKEAKDQRLMELERISMLDQLTQIANRLYLERELEARFAESKSCGSQFGLLFMDVDNFKSVNDTYGHETGDIVLKFVAATLNSNSRPYDLYGRWGGEEFIGVVRNVGPKELEEIGERLCRLVAESFTCNAEGKRIQVTMSVGATLVSEKDTISTLVQRADALMYQSKAQGKNRLTFG
jgi:diguanylate cyclase (GGDEF)-like protein